MRTLFQAAALCVVASIVLTLPALAADTTVSIPVDTWLNPILEFLGVIAAGLWGIEHQLEPGDPFVGNAYADPDVERIPSTLVEAIELFRTSEVAKWAFGDEVHQHLLNSAEQEWAAFNRAVTDWELRRNFEQL